ncbi:hypothetical protein PSTG_13310 [Puccinia striiformis f. sp. tritici PST-78]|uniref:Uncharacterized protein n=1 Tax=Puccinia striiformis f. sp. tritici PST-78 TaxID=1165861 RepID=A0A0L0V310_9BASI|nr:hypothetical protein PSTG_13310 [Puccinia striiformis f. sp. tritici PST-78]
MASWHFDAHFALRRVSSSSWSKGFTAPVVGGVNHRGGQEGQFVPNQGAKLTPCPARCVSLPLGTGDGDNSPDAELAPQKLAPPKGRTCVKLGVQCCSIFPRISPAGQPPPGFCDTILHHGCNKTLNELQAVFTMFACSPGAKFGFWCTTGQPAELSLLHSPTANAPGVMVSIGGDLSRVTGEGLGVAPDTGFLGPLGYDNKLNPNAHVDSDQDRRKLE